MVLALEPKIVLLDEPTAGLTTLERGLAHPVAAEYRQDFTPP
jgi:energy-coupling factor transporter ATP-binding protein EcfA2